MMLWRGIGRNVTKGDEGWLEKVVKEESDGSRKLVGQKINSNGLFVNDIIFWKEKGKNRTSYLGK